MREEIIDGKPEVLRTTILAKDHPEIAAAFDRAVRLGRHVYDVRVVQ